MSTQVICVSIASIVLIVSGMSPNMKEIVSLTEPGGCIL